MIEIDHHPPAGNAHDRAYFTVHVNLQPGMRLHLMLIKSAHGDDLHLLDVALAKGLFGRKGNGVRFAHFFAFQLFIQAGQQLLLADTDDRGRKLTVFRREMMLFGHAFAGSVKDRAVGQFASIFYLNEVVVVDSFIIFVSHRRCRRNTIYKLFLEDTPEFSLLPARH